MPSGTAVTVSERVDNFARESAEAKGVLRHERLLECRVVARERGGGERGREREREREREEERERREREREREREGELFLTVLERVTCGHRDPPKREGLQPTMKCEGWEGAAIQ